MDQGLEKRIGQRKLTRRDFIWLTSAASLTASSSIISGCAVNPVTGEQQIMLMSEAQEIAIDKKRAPQQFSADYGELQDRRINRYIDKVGKKIAKRSHRPTMPYSFRGVNATYINAYAFPGGSIAATRGILLEMESEAELAALMGHEVGHVNARHAAQRQTKGLLTNLAVMAASGYISHQTSGQFDGLIKTVGALGSQAFLSFYSRENEREADALAMEYMTRNQYNPKGVADLMTRLQSRSRAEPSLLETMFSTHPMSSERLRTARQSANRKYAAFKKAPIHRERYKDNIASLRRQKGAIKNIQNGETALNKKKYSRALSFLQKALRRSPRDYTALVLASRANIALDRDRDALRYAKKAQQVMPNEAQAHQFAGVALLALRRYDRAYQSLERYDRLLPNSNPGISFLKGISLEHMQQTRGAAREYRRFLAQVKSGKQAKYAMQRLSKWGYLKNNQQKLTQ
ncbi:M48 family metalloprotease [Magnetococcales bacterium HHB-1]